MTIGAAQQFFLGASKATGGGAAGYQIERSLRFNSNDSAFCSRTPASAGNRKTWTFAAWMKRCRPGNIDHVINGVGGGSPSYSLLYIYSSDTLDFDGGGAGSFSTTQVFRDPSAWYHIVLAFDTTQATSSNRIKLWVNGQQVTAFNSISYPTQNADGGLNQAGLHKIGNWSSEYSNFYLADIHFVDGQALTPSSFTEVSATTGQLIPKAYTGSFGTNGFWLKFSDNSAATATTLGKDYSGNSNNWTPNNVSVITGGPTSVAAASGALPIYSTTDTYGATKGTGTRTDSNSSSIVLAIPMDGANNGTTFTDESATIKGSGSSKSITPSTTVTSTTRSKYYGSSGYFNGASSSLGVGSSADFSFGTGDFTAECWVYLNSQGGGGYNHYFSIQTQNTFALKSWSGGFYLYANSGTVVTTSSTPPLNKWTHLAVVRNGSTLTIYVDGIASGTASTSASFGANASATIGTAGGTPGEFLDGYMQDLRVYKGVAKYTSNFNPPSSTQNPTLAAGSDSLVDTPTSGSQVDTGLGGQVTGNYATFLGTPSAAVASNFTRTNGNLDASGSNANQLPLPASIFPSSGKWYCELVRTSGSGARFGVINTNGLNEGLGNGSNGWCFLDDGRVFYNGSASSYGSAIATNDIFMIALDIDAGKVWYGNNGTWFASGNPSTGANASQSFTAGQTITFAVATGGACAFTSNWGARPFAYTAPSGFKALCDTNLPAPVVAKPNTAMDVKLYTGNGTGQAITGLAFSPDFIWTKSRSRVDNHGLHDIVRGRASNLYSDLTNPENISSAGADLVSFDANGYTLGTVEQTAMNRSGETYVAWTWDAGTSTVTNTQGSITSQVRANASAGFSVVTYTGTGANATVGHGLGVAPAMIIAKSRNNTGGDSGIWVVYHKNLTSAAYFLYLNQTNGETGATTVWNGTAPTSSVFSIGTASGSGTASDHVAYCFAPVVGYSSFGSYTGNGSADGPFVYTGFRPKWLLVKRTDTTGDWVINDSVRNSYNVCDLWLYPNYSLAELTVATVDFTSNGFKIRNAGSNQNTSGGTYIYFAVAENPFQYARAR